MYSAWFAPRGFRGIMVSRRIQWRKPTVSVIKKPTGSPRHNKYLNPRIAWLTIRVSRIDGTWKIDVPYNLFTASISNAEPSPCRMHQDFRRQWIRIIEGRNGNRYKTLLGYLEMYNGIEAGKHGRMGGYVGGWWSLLWQGILKFPIILYSIIRNRRYGY